MEILKKILAGTLSVALIFVMLQFLPKEEYAGTGVRIAISNDSAGLIIDYINNKQGNISVEPLDLEAHILGDC